MSLSSELGQGLGSLPVVSDLGANFRFWGRLWCGVAFWTDLAPNAGSLTRLQVDLAGGGVLNFKPVALDPKV